MIWYMGVTFAASVAIVVLTVAHVLFLAHEYRMDKRWESRQSEAIVVENDDYKVTIEEKR